MLELESDREVCGSDRATCEQLAEHWPPETLISSRSQPLDLGCSKKRHFRRCSSRATSRDRFSISLASSHNASISWSVDVCGVLPRAISESSTCSKREVNLWVE